MKVSIIGTGRVGATTASLIASNPDIKTLQLYNRHPEKAQGLKSDLMGAFPESYDKIHIVEREAAFEADIIILTLGAFGAPSGQSLWEINHPIIEKILPDTIPNPHSKIIVTTTPCDQIAHLIYQKTNHPPENIIGFGGQLDENRLRFLIAEETGSLPQEDVYFIGEHGARGIPIFPEITGDRNKIIQHSKQFFGHYLSDYGASTFGTAQELTKLTHALLSEEQTTLTFSTFHPDHHLFITWPQHLHNGKTTPLTLELSKTEKEDFTTLIEQRKKQESP